MHAAPRFRPVPPSLLSDCSAFPAPERHLGPPGARTPTPQVPATRTHLLSADAPLCAVHAGNHTPRGLACLASHRAPFSGFPHAAAGPDSSPSPLRGVDGPPCFPSRPGGHCWVAAPFCPLCTGPWQILTLVWTGAFNHLESVPRDGVAGPRGDSECHCGGPGSPRRHQNFVWYLSTFQKPTATAGRVPGPLVVCFQLGLLRWGGMAGVRVCCTLRGHVLQVRPACVSPALGCSLSGMAGSHGHSVSLLEEPPQGLHSSSQSPTLSRPHVLPLLVGELASHCWASVRRWLACGCLVRSSPVRSLAPFYGCFVCVVEKVLVFPNRLFFSLVLLVLQFVWGRSGGPGPCCPLAASTPDTSVLGFSLRRLSSEAARSPAGRLALGRRCPFGQRGEGVRTGAEGRVLPFRGATLQPRGDGGAGAALSYGLVQSGTGREPRATRPGRARSGPAAQAGALRAATLCKQLGGG